MDLNQENVRKPKNRWKSKKKKKKKRGPSLRACKHILRVNPRSLICRRVCITEMRLIQKRYHYHNHGFNHFNHQPSLHFSSSSLPESRNSHDSFSHTPAHNDPQPPSKHDQRFVVIFRTLFYLLASSRDEATTTPPHTDVFSLHAYSTSQPLAPYGRTMYIFEFGYVCL